MSRVMSARTRTVKGLGETMRRLSRERRCEVLALLNDGMSIRAVERHTAVHRDTIGRLLVDMGRVCAQEHGQRVRNLRCRYIQADELWAFVERKSYTPEGARDVMSDIWTFTCIDAKTKLVPTWLVGSRDVQTAIRFLRDLDRRVVSNFQLSTDAASLYIEAVREVFGGHIDYGQIWKHSVSKEYAQRVPKSKRKPRAIYGKADGRHIRTAFIERHNQTMRTHLRRYTRKTNAFSKKVRNHQAAVAVFIMFYNFVRPHQTLTKAAHGKPTTPAMAAGLAPRPWTMDQLVMLLEAGEDDAIEVAKRRHDRRRD